jgi:hypothetical protein
VATHPPDAQAGPLGAPAPRRARAQGRLVGAALGLGLFLAAFLPRARDLATFVTWDELFWTHAALHFNREVEGQDWQGTYVIGQPGVVTMWLGTLGLISRAALGQGAPWEAVLSAGEGRYRDDDPALLDQLWRHWQGLGLVTALVTSLAVALAGLALRPLWGGGAALSAGLLLAWDPYFVAHSRVMALDAVLASLCLLGLVAVGRYVRDLGRPALAAGAALAGLALVQKLPGGAMVLYGLPWVTVASWRSERRAGRALGVAGLWLGGAAVVAWLSWPVLWLAPLETAAKLLATLTTYQASAYDPMFFAGRGGEPPGPLYYPTVAWFRTTPVVLAGLLLLGWAALRGRAIANRWSVALLVGFSLAYGALLTLPATKFDRYLLPALLPAIALAGLGWAAGLAERWPGQSARLLGPLVAGTLALLTLAGTPHPYPLAYYSPLAGGLPAASRLLPIGWGEGLDQLRTALGRRTAARAGGAPLRVATDGPVALAGLAGVQPVRATGEACRTADLVLVTLSDRQLGRPAARAYADAVPEHAAVIGGTAVAWLYAGGRPCGAAEDRPAED